MRAATLKGAQRVVSACMSPPMRPVAARWLHTPSACPAASVLQSSSHNSSLLRSFITSSRPRRSAIRPMATAAVELRAGPPAPPKEQVLTQDPANNVTEYIYSRMGINLHHQPHHPIGIIKQAIYNYFINKHPGEFTTFDDMFPVVTCEANFDEILIPADHVSRQPNDTYYVSSDKVLRCHTSAHQAELLRKKLGGFLVTGA
eukprot:GHUV01017430.1.p1 GENE.GHUV01017430.1~~GHUV01017430.1.p1  ORF type:complete len:202 (+),score=53.88 GHUV01017430.1:175-780(+)